jgi:hypothetical protein
MSPLDQVDVLIRRRNGMVFASIPQLNLYAKGDNVDAALAALDAKKAALAADLAEVGELESLEITPSSYAVGQPMPPGMAPAGMRAFVIKTGIVAIAIAAVIVVSGVFVASSLQAVVGDIKTVKIGGEPFWSHVEEQVDQMASPQNDLPEAKKQKLLADIRAIGAKWRPFLLELRSALNPPDDPSAQRPEPAGANK